MHSKLLPTLVMTILLALVLVGCGSTSAAPIPLAVLSEAVGDVSVSNDGGSWGGAQVGMSLDTGDGVKTGDDSTAQITFLDGSTIDLAANTEIDIVALEISSETGSKTIRLDQIIGDTVSRVTHLVDPESSYEINTPTGTAGVRGSTMEVYVSEDGTTWITNLEGDVYAIAQGVDVEIPQGRQCIIMHDQPPKLIYNLTIDNTIGGTVVTPGEGTFTYEAGTVVSLNALPDDTYNFANWTGDVSSIGNVTAAHTTITMNGDYSITANFVQGQPIRTWHDLDAIRDNPTASYTLVNNLDSVTPGYTELAGPTANDGQGWQPVGTSDVPFTGTFDGQGYVIEELFIDRPDESSVGLFGSIYGTIEDVGLLNVDVTGHSEVGGLVGYSEGGNVSNSYATGSVTGKENLSGNEWSVGGLVGEMYMGTLSNSYSTCSVNGDFSVGGLVGENDGTGIVSDCHATGNVNCNFSDAGGLVGYSEGTVSGSYSTGNVSGSNDVGGLVGDNYYDIVVDNCYSTGSVTGYESIGGLIGYNDDGDVTNSYATGSVSGDYDVGGLVGDLVYGTVSGCYAIGDVAGSSDRIGGLVGEHDGAVEDSYSTGSVTGNNDVGGLVGDIYGGTVSSSYSTGTVTGNEYVGGLVGYNQYGTVSRSFWDTETSGTEVSDGGTGGATAEMQNTDTFSGADWDIIHVQSGQTNSDYIWNIVDTVTYPFLSWQPA
jgi:hypothetical protein